MNIWNSVQRGLEKASQEAARIAKIQRLRTTLDGLYKQIDTQQGKLITTAMELFTTGQLTQNELVLICQELNNLQQHLVQMQSELKLLQSQGTQPVQPNATGAYPQQSQGTPYTSGMDSQLAPTVYVPSPNYQPYDKTIPSLVPPPPPGTDPSTVGFLETMVMNTPSSIVEPSHCKVCQSTLIPGSIFCHNCGTSLHAEFSYEPTVLGNIEEASTEDEDKKYTQQAIEADATIRTGTSSIPSSVNTAQHQEGGQ